DGEDASAQDEFSQRPNSSAAHQPIFTASNVHRSPVHLLAFNAQLNVVVSCDVTGFVEYWVPEETCPPPSPLKVPGVFQLKSTTDLFEFKKTKTVPTTLTFSRDGEKFAIFSAVDRKIRVFDFRTAKIARRYDESLEALQALQAQPAPTGDQLQARPDGVRTPICVGARDHRIERSGTAIGSGECQLRIHVERRVRRVGPLHHLRLAAWDQVCQSRHGPRRAAAGQGRERAVHASCTVSGRARSQGQLARSSRIRESAAGQARFGGSDAVCHRIWQGTLLYVYARRSGCAGQFGRCERRRSRC
ncbi:hypothetical protein Golomagni_07463, partial [Golovinomyces magnicellulatus]